MKIVNIIGGLGNQMFQYAFALALQHRFPDENVLIDPSCFKGYPLHNGYELKRIFNISITEATAWQQLQLFYPLQNYRVWQLAKRFFPRRKTVLYEPKDMSFDSTIASDPKSAYYLGYWQTEKYFKDYRKEILNAFRFPSVINDNNAKVIERISNRNAVSIHVRRGDYVKIEATQGICTLTYYQNAINLIKKTSPDMYLIFSDGIDWCRDNLTELFGEAEVVYVDWNKGSNSYRDMQLMSLCRHNIIANSSFSWWGAWLNQNPDKIVISPSHWMNGEGWGDIIPDEWVKIEV